MIGSPHGHVTLRPLPPARTHERILAQRLKHRIRRRVEVAEDDVRRLRRDLPPDLLHRRPPRNERVAVHIHHDQPHRPRRKHRPAPCDPALRYRLQRQLSTRPFANTVSLRRRCGCIIALPHTPTPLNTAPRPPDSTTTTTSGTCFNRHSRPHPPSPPPACPHSTPAPHRIRRPDPPSPQHARPSPTSAAHDAISTHNTAHPNERAYPKPRRRQKMPPVTISGHA